MNKRIIAWACFSVMLSIGLGAFGAHGLRQLTTNEDILRGYQTGVDYHLFHSLVFLLFGIGFTRFDELKLSKAALFLMPIGLILFSGSLYLLTLLRLNAWSYKWIGPITPMGGGLLILAWAWLGYSFLRPERSN